MANKYFFAQPQPVYAWIPTTYEIEQKNTTYRGEKFISDQTTFMMEIMKFLPNIKKEAYRKGVSYKNDSEYENRLESYDNQYYNKYYNENNPLLYGIDTPHLNKGNPHNDEVTKADGQYSFGHQHTFGRAYKETESVVYELTQGFGAGIAVSEDGKGRKKKQIYDFFPNFWDFDGVYKDYLTNANNDRITSFFFSPSDTENTDKNFYRGDYKYDYAKKIESKEYLDRARDAIPIYKPLDTYGGKGFSIYKNGENISSMSFDKFMKFYPKDFTNSFFGRNPTLLIDNKLPSITGYDKINTNGYGYKENDPTTWKTHFQEAIDFFGNEKNPYTSRYGKAKVFDKIDENGQIVYKDESRASFYDLMMDPDAPWNSSEGGQGWWKKENKDEQDKFEELAAFYIVILIVEARRRFLNAMTQWYGPHTQFKGFNENDSVVSTYSNFGKTLNHIFVNNSDDNMIEYFTSWFGNTDKERKNNKYWRIAEAPSFRTQFLDTFMYTYHEMGSFFKLLSGDTTYNYSKADQVVAPRFKNWLKDKFKLLANPKEKVKNPILAGIKPTSVNGDITVNEKDMLNKLKNFINGCLTKSVSSDSPYNPSENEFPTEVKIDFSPVGLYVKGNYISPDKVTHSIVDANYQPGGLDGLYGLGTIDGDINATIYHKHEYQNSYVIIKSTIYATRQNEDSNANYTKGHSITVSHDVIYSTDENTKASALPNNLIITYKNASDFRTAYSNLVNALNQDPTINMTLSSYRALQYGINKSLITIPDYLSPDRWAHQLYKYAFIDKDGNGTSDLEDVINALLEAVRLLKGGAVVELFREYALDETENLGLSDDAPDATAKYSQMVNFKLKTQQKYSGSWHLSVGNLRNDVLSKSVSALEFAENWFQQLTGWNLLWARNKEKIIIKNEEGTYNVGENPSEYKVVEDSPYNRIWGIRTRYLMQNIVTKTIEFMMFQQIVYNLQYEKYKEDMEDYQEQKYEEALEKAREYKKTQERRVKEKELLAKARMKNLEQQKKEARAFRKKQKEKSERSKDKK